MYSDFLVDIFTINFTQKNITKRGWFSSYQITIQLINYFNWKFIIELFLIWLLLKAALTYLFDQSRFIIIIKDVEQVLERDDS